MWDWNQGPPQCNGVFGWAFTSALECSEKRPRLRLVEFELVLSERQPPTRSAPDRSDFEVRAWRDLAGRTGHVTQNAAVAGR